jgi:hypothetical protein
MLRMRTEWACAATMATMATMAIVATPVGAQTDSRMTTGVQQQEQAPPRPTTRLENLSPAERLELLSIAEAERQRGRRGIDADCRPERERKPMTDLERASWRLKCRK